MQFRFCDIAVAKQSIPIHTLFHVDDLVQDRKDITISKPMHIKLSVVAEGNTSAYVQGQLTVTMQLQCSRCLTLFTRTCDIPFVERFQLKDDTLATSNENITMVIDDVVDLKPYVMEVLLLHLPYAPVCKEACAGLCITCGINRNEGQCRCLNKQIDPRLASLQNFFDPTPKEVLPEEI